MFHDYREMLKESDIEMVTIAAPNALHCQMTVDIANAGKHVVCEKPLCMTLEEADIMIDTCRQKGVLLMYGEELFFTPKYVRAKRMADEGAFGKVYLVKQSEKHFGPHSPWFWDANRSGGGALMDLGCHGIAFCYWFLNRPDDQERLLPDGHLRARRQDEVRRQQLLHRRVRGQRRWASSRTVGPAAAAWTTASRSTAKAA